MAIHILTGRPGTGKTYRLTEMAIKFLKEGREVWANKGYTIKDSRIKYYNTISDLVNIRNGVILMDEAQVYLNARRWEELDEQFVYKLQQHRHHGLDIWGTVQNIKRLDVVLRELVSNYYECKFFSFPFIKFIWIREFDIKDAEKTDERRISFGFNFTTIKKEICDMYDTFGDVEDFEDKKKMIITKTFKRCPECGKDRLIM